MDYYQVLDVDRSATVDEVKTAYKQLAIRWHPDKNLNNVQEAGEKFKEIHEAYKVLIDTQKRANFDNKKKQRSNGRVPSPSSFPTEEYNESPSYQYTSFSDSIFNKFFGRGPAIKDPPIEYPVHCTLEDLYVGTIKTIILTRDILSSRGQTKVVKEKLTINIMPGTKNGAKFIFEEKGSEKPNCIPADIIVILHQKPHDLFSREGNDLILKETISLFGIFTCSCSVDFKTLDGRNLTVPINCVSFPFHEKVVRGEGMPLTGDPSKRGDLKIILNVRLF